MARAWSAISASTSCGRIATVTKGFTEGAAPDEGAAAGEAASDCLDDWEEERVRGSLICDRGGFSSNSLFDLVTFSTRRKGRASNDNQSSESKTKLCVVSRRDHSFITATRVSKCFPVAHSSSVCRVHTLGSEWKVGMSLPERRGGERGDLLAVVRLSEKNSRGGESEKTEADLSSSMRRSPSRSFASPTVSWASSNL